MQLNISYQKAVNMLQLNKQNITVPHTFINFRSMIANESLVEYPDDILKEARNVIIRPWIESELQRQGHWDLKAPYKDACSRCNGTGELYKLEKEKFKKDCEV